MPLPEIRTRSQRRIRLGTQPKEGRKNNLSATDVAQTLSLRGPRGHRRLIGTLAGRAPKSVPMSRDAAD